MKSHHVFAVLAGIWLVVMVASAQPKPDFSGRWVIVSPADNAGLEQVVKHDATSLSTSHASEGGGHAAIYKLDGRESRNVIVSHLGPQETTAARPPDQAKRPVPISACLIMVSSGQAVA